MEEDKEDESINMKIVPEETGDKYDIPRSLSQTK